MNQAPIELRAVIHILSSDAVLRRKALRYVNIARREIDWDSIFSQDFGSGHIAAINWAYSIWRDEPMRNPFSGVHSMEITLRKTVLEALGICWGFSPAGPVRPSQANGESARG